MIKSSAKETAGRTPEVYVTVQPAKIPYVRAELGKDWQCYTGKISFKDTPETLKGKKSVPVQFNSRHRIDFTGKFPYRKGIDGTMAILRGEITVERDGFVLFGYGADYYLKIVCDNQVIASTENGGNGGGPTDVKNFISRARLKAGKHEIWCYVGSGSGGWSFAFNTLEPTPQNVSYLDHQEELRNLFPAKAVITHGPWISHLSQTQASIHFTTDGPMGAAVDFRIGKRGKVRRYYDSRNGHIFNDTYRHVIHLNGLKPGTEYRYSVVLFPVRGTETVVEGDFHFKTFPEKETEFSFTTLADTHVVGLCKKELFETFDKIPEFSNADFFAHLGDFNGRFDYYDYDILCGIMDFFSKRQKPFLPVHGNHEYIGAENCFWNYYFAGPDGNSFGYVRHGSTVILFVDFMNDMRDQTRFLQEAWLTKFLESPEFTEAKFRIVLTHSPHFCTKKVINYAEKCMQKFLSKKKIHLLLSGHVHSYMRIEGAKGTFYNRKSYPDKGARPSHNFTFPIVVLDGGSKISEFCCGTVKISGDRLTFTARNSKGVLIDKFHVDADGKVSDEYVSPELEKLSLKK